MRILLCFLYLFLLNVLIMASWQNELFISLFGEAGKNISTLFGLPLILLIRNYFKELKSIVFVLLLILSPSSVYIIMFLVVK
jgi:hypothetical protein